MDNKYVKFGRVAWVTGVIFAGLCLFAMVSMFALSNGPWSVGEIFLTIIAGGTYITGLLIAEKRPLLGGLMSFVLPCSVITVVLYSLRGTPVDMVFLRKTVLQVLVFFIPGIFHLIYWWLKSRAARVEKK